VIVQGVSDSYMATATYQHPVVTTLPLNVISESNRRDPASESPSLQQQDDVDHYYSEINSETTSPSAPSVAAAAGVVPQAVTSSSHVTETDTPTKQTDVSGAAYSGLDTSTMSQHTSLPSVYLTLVNTDEATSLTTS